MIYAVKKFRHYLLANQFVFFVDHQALLYLVNKPCNTGRIVRWFLILLEFDFTVVVKKGTTHQGADHLSRMIHGEAPDGINDDLPDAYLFKIEMVPKWSESLISFLSIGTWNNELCKSNSQRLISQSSPYQIILGKLYRLGNDGDLRLCIDNHEVESYIQASHVCNIYHFSKDQIVKR